MEERKNEKILTSDSIKGLVRNSPNYKPRRLEVEIQNCSKIKIVLRKRWKL